MDQIANGELGLSVRGKLNYKLGEYANLLSYGCVGDGVTDDSVNFQAAIDAVELSGNTLYIPDGIYLITGITIDSPICIIGNGVNSVLKTTTNAVMITVSTNGCEFRNFKCLGTGIASGDTSQHLIQIGSFTRYIFDSVIFYDTNGRGLNLTGSLWEPTTPYVGDEIYNCRFFNCVHGIWQTREDYLSIVNCQFYGCTTGYETGAGNFKVVACKFTKNTNAIVLTDVGNDSHSIIVGCTINHNTNNLTFTDIDNGMIISGCEIHAGLINLTTTIGVGFVGCQFGSITFNFNGSLATRFTDCISYSCIYNDDVGGNTSETTYNGLVDIFSPIVYEIEGPSDTGSLFNVRNKSGTIKHSLYADGGRLSSQLTGVVTDGAPTDSEINTITGFTPATAGAGYYVTIKSNSTNGLLYLVESDGADWFYSVLSDGDAELIERTIYVETTGSDTTGDGTIGAPFATIKKALSNIRSHIWADVTVLFGVGDFTFNEGDFDRLNDLFIHQNYRLSIKGTTVVEKDGTLVFTRDGSDPWLYDVTESGGTPSFTTNEFQDMFIATSADGLAKPIFENNATQIYLADNDNDLSAYDSIYSLGTTITVGARRLLPAFNTHGAGDLYFYFLHFKITDEQRFQQARGTIKMQTNQCIFESMQVNKSNVYQTKEKQFFNTYYDCVFVGWFTTYANVARGATRFNGSTLYNCVIRNKGIQTAGLSPGNHGTNGWQTYDECVFVGWCHAIVLDGGAVLNIEGDLLFKDCGTAFRVYYGGARLVMDFWKLYFNNTNYCWSSFGSKSNMFFTIPSDRVVGAPTTAWRLPVTGGLWGAVSLGNNCIDKNVFYDRDRQIYIRMPDEYPPTEENLSVALTNNAQTDIIVGSKTQNDSIFIKYTVVRDDEVETNTIQISNNGTSVVMAEGTLTGDDAGVSFAVAYNSDDIQLQVTLDDDVAGTFKYNVERTMI